MIDPYAGREQTKAKHFILRRYLQTLAFKVLTFSDITYVDGFSGPWETKTDDFSDSSFRIALSVLQGAHTQVQQRMGVRRRVRCFFSEHDRKAFSQLQAAVAPFRKPAEGFEISTYPGKFEDAVTEIQPLIGNSFALIFIDPTGWTGYPLEKIKPLFARPKAEVLINFMYDHINRFAHSDDPQIIASFEPILGGSGWRHRLDVNLPRGPAVEKLFRQSLKSIGHFEFVVSTKIDKATSERPHLFITYGTKSLAGLKAFRQTEYEALREHRKTRATVKEKKREEARRSADLFAGYDAQVQEASVDQLVEEQRVKAQGHLLTMLAQHDALPFARIVAELLEGYMLREKNIKDICVDLAREGKVENTWGPGNRKPRDGDVIRLRRA